MLSFLVCGQMVGEPISLGVGLAAAEPSAIGEDAQSAFVTLHLTALHHRDIPTIIDRSFGTICDILIQHLD